MPFLAVFHAYQKFAVVADPFHWLKMRQLYPWYNHHDLAMIINRVGRRSGTHHPPLVAATGSPFTAYLISHPVLRPFPIFHDAPIVPVVTAMKRADGRSGTHNSPPDVATGSHFTAFLIPTTKTTPVVISMLPLPTIFHYFKGNVGNLRLDFAFFMISHNEAF